MGPGRPGRPELPAGAVHGGRRPKDFVQSLGRGSLGWDTSPSTAASTSSPRKCWSWGTPICRNFPWPTSSH
jgi:hypothetical protein